MIALDNYHSGDKRNVEHLTANPLFRLVRHDVTFPYFEEVDQIYNLACPSAPADYMHDPVMTLKTSLIGAVNMLEVARRMGARILQASSGKVYGKAQVPSIPEQYRGNVSPVGERSAYEEGKRAAESIFTAYHHQYGVDIRIPRLFECLRTAHAARERTRDLRFHQERAFGREHIDPGQRGADPLFSLYRRRGRGARADDEFDRQAVRTGQYRRRGPGSDRCLGRGRGSFDGKSVESRLLLNLPTDSSQNTVPDIELARRKLDWEPRIPIEEGLTRTLRYFEERMRMENRAYPFMSWVEIM